MQKHVLRFKIRGFLIRFLRYKTLARRLCSKIVTTLHLFRHNASQFQSVITAHSSLASLPEVLEQEVKKLPDAAHCLLSVPAHRSPVAAPAIQEGNQ